MAHEIFGDRFLGRREPAWHGLGQVFSADEVLTTWEGMQRVGLDYTFEKLPIHVTLPSGEVAALPQVAIMRSPTADSPQWTHINTVDPDFGVLQHSDIADVLDSSGISARWPLETLGALRDGGTMFATFRETPYDVKGQQINRFFLVSDGKDGNHALKLAVVHIRVVCQNTLTMALSDKNSVQISLSHHKTIAKDMTNYAQLIAQLEHAQAGVTQFMQQLANVTIDDATVKRIAEIAYPDPATPQKVRLFDQYLKSAKLVKLDAAMIEDMQKASEQYEVRREHQVALRDGIMTCYRKLNDDYPATANTLWHGINAGTEVLDCQAGKSAVSAAQDIMFGHRATARNAVMSYAAKLVNAN